MVSKNTGEAEIDIDGENGHKSRVRREGLWIWKKLGVWEWI